MLAQTTLNDLMAQIRTSLTNLAGSDKLACDSVARDIISDVQKSLNASNLEAAKMSGADLHHHFAQTSLQREAHAIYKQLMNALHLQQKEAAEAAAAAAAAAAAQAAAAQTTTTRSCHRSDVQQKSRTRIRRRSVNHQQEQEDPVQNQQHKMLESQFRCFLGGMEFCRRQLAAAFSSCSSSFSDVQQQHQQQQHPPVSEQQEQNLCSRQSSNSPQQQQTVIEDEREYQHGVCFCVAIIIILFVLPLLFSDAQWLLCVPPVLFFVSPIIAEKLLQVAQQRDCRFGDMRDNEVGAHVLGVLLPIFAMLIAGPVTVAVVSAFFLLRNVDAFAAGEHVSISSQDALKQTAYRRGAQQQPQPAVLHQQQQQQQQSLFCSSS